MTDDLETLPTADLAEVTGGFDFAALGPIAQQLGGLFDSFTGGTKGSQIGGSIGSLIQGFSGLFGAFGGGGSQSQSQGQSPAQGSPAGAEAMQAPTGTA